MKIERAAVTTTNPATRKREQIGEAEFEIFDNLDEAVARLSPDVCLGLINTQHKTNKMNALRASVTGEPTQKELRAKAMQHLVQNEIRKLTEASAQGEDAMNALVESEMNRIKLELVAARKKAAFVAGGDAGGEDAGE